MRMRGLLGVAVVAGLLSLTGCASIINGTSQTISISSIPSGAAVKVFNKYGSVVASSATPCSVRLKRGDGFFSSATYRVLIEKKGYTPFQTQISGNLSIGWYLVGNFFIGGWLGWLLIDPLTGGMWYLEPEQINGYLAKESAWRPGGGRLLAVRITTPRR